ncbi:TetR/AcrR family transcriptional regulator [Parapedomonas caeni]
MNDIPRLASSVSARPSRRDAIADAAEQLFSRRGFFGASVRDIAAAAAVNPGLVTHYFRTKEELFRHVVTRRIDDLHARVADSLERAVVAAEGGTPALPALIRAFIQPFVDLLRADEPGWRHYVRMISHGLTLYDLPELRDPLQDLTGISALFVARVRPLVPDMADRDFYAALYAVEAVMSFLVQDPGFLDNLSRDHHHAGDLDTLLDSLVPFLAGGFAATRQRG